MSREGNDQHQQQQLQQQVAANAVLSSLDKPFTVNSVRITGLNHTRSDLFEPLLKPLMDAKSLGDILAHTQYLTARLERLDIFKNMSVDLDSPPPVSSSSLRGQKANAMLIPPHLVLTPPSQSQKETSSELLDIHLKVEERSRLWAKTGTELGNNEGSMVLYIFNIKGLR
jgi:outer membrane protein insertion porin family